MRLAKVGLLIFSLMTWLPQQEVVYLLPLGLYFLFFIDRSIKHSRDKTAIFSIAFFILIFQAFSMLQNVFYNASAFAPWIWLLTHSYIVFAVLLIFIVKREFYSLNLLLYFLNVNIIIGVIEAVIGTMQYVAGPSFADTAAAGDYVLGTLGNNSHLFAMKMLLLSIISGFMYSYKKKKVYLLALFVLLQAWLLGSALHTILVMAMAYALYFLLVTKNLYQVMKRLIVYSSIVGIVIASLFVIQENNVRYLLNKLSFENTAAPVTLLFGKVALFKRTLFDISNQDGFGAAAFGFGAGSYSSRASWMISGHYLGNQSIVPVAPSYAWQHYLSDLWDTELLKRYKWMQGVANQPFSTWMTILGEFGWLGLLVTLIFSIKLLIKLRTRIKARDNVFAQCALFICCFTLASFFFDNWDEYPRFFLPIILFVVMTLKINHKHIKVPRYVLHREGVVS